MMRKNLFRLALGSAALGLSVLVLPLASRALPADVTDPAIIPLPAFDAAAADPAKAIVVRLDFQSRSTATLDEAVVSIQRAHSHIGDPPILRLTLKDVDGAVISQMNAWSPLWVFTNDGQERLEIQSSGSGSFVVPFAPGLSTMTVRDIDLAQDVISVDLEAPIRDFCIANPSDPDCVEADLSVDAITPTAPLFAVVGEPVTVSIASTVSNAGPDGPVDAEVTRAATAGAGLTLSPTVSDTVDVDALAVGVPRQSVKTYTVSCTEAGVRTIDFTTSIAPKLAAVVDPDATDNSKTVQLSVDCAVPVTINVQPKSKVNPVNRNGSTLPVAVLTTAVGEYGHTIAFNATTIDPLSVRFSSRSVLLAAGGVPEIHGKIHPEDSYELDESTRDGDLDVLLHFAPRKDSLASSDVEGCVFGRFAGVSGSTAFFGCDHISVKK
ncbi:MAG: hypothetical protein WEG56_14065 [Chloroflexota bacterium]